MATGDQLAVLTRRQGHTDQAKGGRTRFADLVEVGQFSLTGILILASELRKPQNNVSASNAVALW